MASGTFGFREEFLETNKRVAEIIIGESKKYVPVLTGALAQSVRNASTKKSAKVRAGNVGVPYAGPIHFGWPSRGIRPNPFFYDAIDNRRDEVRDRYVDLVDKLTIKYNLR